MSAEVPSPARRFEVAAQYVAAWWLPGPHAQTVGARWTRPRTGVALHRERITTPDDDFLDLDWAVDAAEPFPRALAIVLHGLEGSARSGYALEAYRQLGIRGVGAVGLNFRSCSGELNRGRRLYHSGDTDDLRFVVEHVRKRCPGVRLGAIGFSLGGNVLLKYLGEEGQKEEGAPGWPGRERCAVQAAAAVSVPYDLAASADFTEHGLARLYILRLLRSLRRKVRLREKDLGAHIDAARAKEARTFREFDTAATAPLHGFRDADDYYARSSSAGFLSAVRIPTLLVHAADDPFLPRGAVPRAIVRSNPTLHPLFTDTGGHVGFVAGHPWRRQYWAEARAAAFLADRLRPGRPPSAT